MDGEQPRRNRAHMQPSRARMDQLLRPFLPDVVGGHSAASIDIWCGGPEGSTSG